MCYKYGKYFGRKQGRTEDFSHGGQETLGTKN